MKAAVLHGRERILVEEIHPQPLSLGQVRIDIQAALTCGTDLKVFKRGYHARMIVPPSVFGHELAGVISELGPGVANWNPGDRVVVANSAPCGDCRFCRQGRENLCDDLLFLNGAYAESIVVPRRLVERNLLLLKPGTPFKAAALVEPLACVVQGIEESNVSRESRALVIGSGPIGLMFVILLKHAGCHVVLAGRGEARLATAGRLGVDQVVNVTGKTDLAAAIKSDAPAQFDVVIEAVGKPETWEAAVKLVGKGGQVNFFGGCPAGAAVSLDPALIHYASVTLRASFHHTPRAIRRALGLIESGVIHADSLIDGECSLTGLPELFKSMAAGNRAIKTLIRVHE